MPLNSRSKGVSSYILCFLFYNSNVIEASVFFCEEGLELNMFVMKVLNETNL